MDISLVRLRPNAHDDWAYAGLADVRACSLQVALEESFDVVVATWWETAMSLFRLRARRYAYFVQLLEDSHYPPGMPERLGFQLTLGMPVRFVTEAGWIRDFLRAVQPGNEPLYVRNGIDKEIFAFRSPIEAAPSGPLRIVIEGNVDLPRKATPHALAAVELMRRPRHVTLVTGARPTHSVPGADEELAGLTQTELAAVFARSHVLLKLSRAEGMFGPPLEAFHMGCTCVVNPVTGHDEYVAHLTNGLVVDWDDPLGTARALDLLATDRWLLHRLRLGALDTARGWPSWRQASSFMALALRRIAEEPAPDPAIAGRRMGSGIVATLAEAHTRHVEAEQAKNAREELLEQRAVRLGVKARRYATPALRAVRAVRRRVGSR